GQTAGGFDFEKAGGGIEQGHRTAGSAHQLNGLVHDELQRFVWLESGMNDVADLIEQVEPFVAGFEIGQFVAHRFMRRLFTLSASPVFRSAAKYALSAVGTSRCDVRAACSDATPSNGSVPWTFVPPATARAGTAQRAIPPIALNTYAAKAAE